MKTNLIDKLIFVVALAFSVCVVGIIAQVSVRTNASAEPQGIKLPIVMYHHILKEQSRLNKFTISPDEFRKDLQYLKDNGYTPIVMQDLIEHAQNKTPIPEKAIIITFDDGYESFYEYAYPLIKDYNIKVVFSVVGRYVDQFSKDSDHNVIYSHCTWDQLALMQESGLVEMQNHSYNLHTDGERRRGSMKYAGENLESYHKMLKDDLQKLQLECAENLGCIPTTFTYPFGLISPEALPIVKELGFSAALTCNEKFNYITGEPEQLYHLNRFIRPHGTSLQSILEKAK
ncbi:polysaccharide deacetylase family protein [Oscillospiraceae bacterium PP1C4]